MRPHAPPTWPAASSAPRPVDLGWLFLLPGIVLIAAAVLIAAEDDLYAARFRRDEALAIERRHAERVERYEAYLEAVRRHDPTVVRSLVAGQLNAAPTDMVEERVAGVPVYDPGQVFASLEPPEAQPAVRVSVNSVLGRWATNDSSRVWLMASGALCVFVGLLPPVNRRAGSAPTGTSLETDEAEEPGAEESLDGTDDPVINFADEDAIDSPGEPQADVEDDHEDPDEVAQAVDDDAAADDGILEDGDEGSADELEAREALDTRAE